MKGEILYDIILYIYYRYVKELFSNNEFREKRTILMLEYIHKTNRIYDLMALCCSFIFKEYERNPIEFNEFDDEKYNEIYDMLDDYCEMRKYEGEAKAFIKLRENIIEFMKPDIDAEKCFAIVKYIDDLIEPEIYGSLMGGNHIVKYTSLNHNYLDCVKIIPVMEKTLLSRGNNELCDNNYSFFRDRRDSEWSPLDREMLNYMIWNEEYIKKYPVQIYHYDHMSQVVDHFRKKNNIVIGIVPFSNEKTEKLLDIYYEKKLFFINGLKEDAIEKLKTRYVDICKRAEKEGIDLLIFPEMLMSDTIIASKEKKEGKRNPYVIINGSIWEDKMNRSVVTDGNGNQILNYLKKEPFIYRHDNVEYKEWLDKEKNKEYCILEIEGIGRIGIGICKDLINENVKLFHKYIQTNMLLIPAYSKSMDLLASAEELSKEYNCIVVVANACSALEEKKLEREEDRVGFITLPAKKGTDRSAIILRYYRNECREECASKCVGKKIIIDFSNSNMYENKKSYNVVETTF